MAFYTPFFLYGIKAPAIKEQELPVAVNWQPQNISF